ncbi:hypothetical protein EHW67_18870 [Arenibacter aquaticus]|uniref:Uncharacterized protein n=1 Tax=Arenibacter aquaticus TaxID=2489054 RepID=A0A430K015_9FLAO|nr:hypothetical protein [Arenibacter aquaticus]RTE52248.1 hypothetical protein EHW67_18870 [Arenibacter aquaticus]
MRTSKALILLIFLISFGSCVESKHQDQVNLKLQEFKDAIYSGQTYLFYHQNDSIGEWGGTEILLKLKGDPESKKVLLDIKKVLASKVPPPPPHSDSLRIYYDKLTIIDTSDITLDDDQVLLAIKSISELSQRKLISTPNSGYYCFDGHKHEIINADSTLIISDCTSLPWESFLELNRSLKNK